MAPHTPDPLPARSNPDSRTVLDTAATVRSEGAAAPSGAGQLPPPPVPDHELLRPIGRGSYGEVWLARNIMGTFRAVKVVYRAWFDREKPFEREFTGIQKFEPLSRSHSALVDVLQIGRTPECFYYVMELADDVVTGQEIDPARYQPRTLRQEVVERGQVPIERCVEIGLGLASGLQHLHSHGLIHRDIKPSNIIFVHGQPKLADIGLVAEQSEAKSFVGTEGFIPPEGPGTPAADVYSLGKVLYEMATGKDRHEFPELPSLTGTEEEAGLVELNAIVLKACQNEVKLRYASAEELQGDLLLLQSGKSVKRAQVLERRFRLLLQGSVVGIVATFLAFGAVYFFRQQAARENELRREADTHRTRAETNALATLRLLIKSHVATGNQLAGNLDFLAALPWYAEALRLEPEPDQARLHRLRLTYALCQAPRLRHVWRHQDRVTDLAISPTQHLVATASDDRTARIWDLTSGEPATGSLVHSNAVESVVFSSDGQRLLTRTGSGTSPDAGEAGSVEMWEVASGRRLWRLAHRGKVHHAELSRDGALVVSASADDRTRVWRASDGALIREIAHTNALRHAAFSPDATRLVTTEDTGAVRLWETASGRLIRTWRNDSTAYRPGNELQVRSNFSPDGRRVLGVNRRSLAIWDPDGESGEPLFRDTVDHATSVEVDRSGARLLVGDFHADFRIWNLRSNLLERFVNIPHLEGDTYGTFRSTFSEDGSSVLTFGSHGLEIWSAGGGYRRSIFVPVHGRVYDAAMVRDDRYLLVATGDGAVRVWEIWASALPGRAIPLQGVATQLRSASDGRRVFISENVSKVELMDATTGKPFVSPTNFPVHPMAVWGIQHLRLSPDDRFIFASDAAGRGRVYDANTGATLGPYLGHSASEDRIFAPPGLFTDRPDQLITADQEGTFRLWDFTTGQVLRERRSTRPGMIWELAGVPGKPLAVSRGEGDPLQVWDTRTLEPVPDWPAASDPLEDIDVSSDGRLIASVGGEGGRIDVWDLEARRHLGRWSAGREVRSIAFDREARRLGATCADGRVRIWDVARGTLLVTTAVADPNLGALQFSGDGRFCAAQSSSGAHLWDAVSGDAISPRVRLAGPNGAFANDIGFTADHLHLLAAGDRFLHVLDLEPLPFSDVEWQTLAQNFSGHRINRDGAAEAYSEAGSWQEHRQLVDRLDRAVGWTGEALLRQPRPHVGNLLPAWTRYLEFLDGLTAENKGSPTWKELKAEALYRTGRFQEAAALDALWAIPPRDPAATWRQIDLAPHFHFLFVPRGIGPDFDDLAGVEPGLRRIQGQLFDLRGVVALFGENDQGGNLPRSVTNLRLGGKAERLHFIHATMWAAPPGTLVATYVLRYADGSSAELPVRYGEEVLDWYPQTGEGPTTKARLVLQTERQNKRLFLSSYANPHPDRTIESLDVVSAGTRPSLMLLAATVE